MKTRHHCIGCEIFLKELLSDEPMICSWYMDNVAMGMKQTENCPEKIDFEHPVWDKLKKYKKE